MQQLQQRELFLRHPDRDDVRRDLGQRRGAMADERLDARHVVRGERARRRLHAQHVAVGEHDARGVAGERERCTEQAIPTLQVNDDVARVYTDMLREQE